LQTIPTDGENGFYAVGSGDQGRAAERLARPTFLVILARMVQRGAWGVLKRRAVCWANEVHVVAVPRLRAPLGVSRDLDAELTVACARNANDKCLNHDGDGADDLNTDHAR
jgi:hypothetical protein